MTDTIDVAEIIGEICPQCSRTLGREIRVISFDTHVCVDPDVVVNFDPVPVADWETIRTSIGSLLGIAQALDDRQKTQLKQEKQRPTTTELMDGLQGLRDDLAGLNKKIDFLVNQLTTGGETK